MKFTIAKREVDVRLEHIILVAVLFIILATGIMLLSLAVAFAATGGLAPENIVWASVYVTTILSVVSGPVISYLILEAGGIAKMKRDVAFCRSVSAASFIISASVCIIIFAFLFAAQAVETMAFSGGYGDGSQVLEMFPLFGLPLFAGELLSMGAGAAMGYFWLLLVLEFKPVRIKNAIGNAFAFAIILFLLDQAVIFALDYQLGNVQAWEFDGSMVVALIRDFIFAFVILYHALGRKLDTEAAGLFAGVYLAATVAFTIHNTLAVPWPVISLIAEVARAIIAIALLYALSRTKDITP
jgi:hypothetical protein